MIESGRTDTLPKPPTWRIIFRANEGVVVERALHRNVLLAGVPPSTWKRKLLKRIFGWDTKLTKPGERT